MKVGTSVSQWRHHQCGTVTVKRLGLQRRKKIHNLTSVVLLFASFGLKQICLVVGSLTKDQMRGSGLNPDQTRWTQTDFLLPEYILKNVRLNVMKRKLTGKNLVF